MFRWCSAAILSGFLMVGLGLSLEFGFEELDRPQGPNHDAIARAGIAAAIFLVVATWVFWIAVFMLTWAGKWSRTFRTMYTALFAGTILELMISIPIDVYVRRKTFCYCVSGTIIGMAVGFATGIWIFGPGLFFLLGTRYDQRRNRLWFCRHCGEDMRPYTDATRCTRCGREFTPPRSRLS